METQPPSSDFSSSYVSLGYEGMASVNGFGGYPAGQRTEFTVPADKKVFFISEAEAEADVFVLLQAFEHLKRKVHPVDLIAQVIEGGQSCCDYFCQRWPALGDDCGIYAWYENRLNCLDDFSEEKVNPISLQQILKIPHVRRVYWLAGRHALSMS